MLQFKKAQKAQSRLRLALSGPSGGGKTLSALKLARGIVGEEGRIAVVDTEHNSAALYSDLYEFDTLSLAPPYAPSRFIEAINASVAAKYDILILDSITHEWKGQGGVLDIHNQVVSTQRGGNSYTAWNQVTPQHQAFIDAMLSAPIHIIATMRAKTAYAQGERNGKKYIEKMGEAAEQRDGIEFEFTTVLDLVVNGNYATVSKDRTRLFNPQTPVVLDETWGVKLREWLDSGIPVEEAEWEATTALKAASQKWINRALETGAWEKALASVPNTFKGRDAEYVTNQLKLARDVISVDEPKSSSAEPEPSYAEPDFGDGESEDNGQKTKAQNDNQTDSGATEKGYIEPENEPDFELQGMGG